MLPMIWRIIAKISVLLIFVTAGGCSSEAGEVSAGEARFLLPATSDSIFDAYNYTSSDIGEFAAASDVVFVASIVGTKRDVSESRLTDDPDNPGLLVMEQDGIIFRVEEVLTGDGIARGAETTVAHPVAIRGIQIQDDPADSPSPAEPQIIEVEPITLLRDGIRDVEAGRKSPSYLVFANRLSFESGEMLGFNGPGAVTEISPEGVLKATDLTPFGPTTADTNLYKIDITVDVVRKWIDGDPPLIEVPGDAKPQPGETPPTDE